MENFIVSARKYRPATFDTVVGQKAITNTLKNAIKNHYLAQAYLFTGPRGVGKTTAARIFAKTINCLNIDLENKPDIIEPCNVCESCLSFSQNASFNIMELDAASNNSVDDIRRLVEQVRIPPQVGKYKVYIIDEVHMLSQQAFNAFLKTLEEPPAYVKFILATTEKHKIIPTILSRCQVFDFKRINVNDIAQYLRFVAESEHIKAEEEALQLIGQKADGSMRDALSIFDQLVSYTNANVTYENVIENLHVLDYDYFFKISDQFLSGDVTSVLVILNDIIERGFDGQHFLIGLGEHLRNLLISRDTKTINLLETSLSIKNRYFENSSKFPPSFLLKALDLNTQCDVNYKGSNNKRLLIELTLMQMVALGSGINDETPKERIPALAVPKKAKEEISAPEPIEPPKVLAPPIEEVAEVVPEPKVTPIPEPQSSSPSPVNLPKKEEKQNPRVQGIPKGMGLGVSIKQEEKAESEEAPDAYMLGNEDVADAYSPEDFEAVFNEFLETIKERQGLYATLKTNKPILKAGHVFEIHVYNDAQRALLYEKRFDLMKLMRIKLNNYQLKSEIKIIENGNTVKPASPAERYTNMVEKNPNLQKLRDNLSLELEF